MARGAVRGTPITIRPTCRPDIAGILLDATVVRALLVPALVSLMDHWNSWLPSWLSGLAPEPGPVTAGASPPSSPAGGDPGG